MPSPIAHSLTGYIIYRAASPVHARRWQHVVLHLFAANAPDLDFLPGFLIGDPDLYHHGVSHSIGFAVLFASALSLFLDAARGARIVSLDGDLQNDPQDIAQLLKKLDEGYDAVSGWRIHRQESFWLRRLPSRLANWLIRQTTEVHLHDYGSTLKAYRAELVKKLRLYGEMHRFIPALMWGNGRIAELSVQHWPRLHGQSKYGISRTVRVLLDLITVKFCLTSLTRPLQFFGLIGLVTSGQAWQCVCILQASDSFGGTL